MGLGGNISPTAFIAANATVLGDVTIGDLAGIWFGTVVRGDRDLIRIGDRSNVQDNAVVHTSVGFPVILGEEVSVGHGAVLHGCTIRDQVLIGMGAIVMNGAIIGEGSLVGAGAVITEGAEIPLNSIVLGVPGKVVRETTEAQRAHIVENARNYIALAKRYHDR